jgi:hypothetical protein
MAILSGTVSGNRTPDNVSSGDYTYTVVGTHVCGSAVQPFVLSDTLGMTAGRYVLLRATVDITGYVGATVTPPTGLTVYSVSKEPVTYGSTTYQCIVVTLV